MQHKNTYGPDPFLYIRTQAVYSLLIKKNKNVLKVK